MWWLNFFYTFCIFFIHTKFFILKKPTLPRIFCTFFVRGDFFSFWILNYSKWKVFFFYFVNTFFFYDIQRDIFIIKNQRKIDEIHFFQIHSSLKTSKKYKNLKCIKKKAWKREACKIEKTRNYKKICI